MTDRVTITFTESPDATVVVTAPHIYAAECCLVMELDVEGDLVQAHPLHTIKFFKLEHNINDQA